MSGQDDARQRHFVRRERAARQGTHLPSEADLVLGMSFMGGELQRDVREFAGRLATHLRRKGRAATAELVRALERAEAIQDIEAVEAVEEAARACELASGETAWFRGHLSGVNLRCLVYRAYLGDFSACAGLAGHTARRAVARSGVTAGDRTSLLGRALAWAAVARRVMEYEARFGQKHRNPIDSEVDALSADFRDAVLVASEGSVVSGPASGENGPPSGGGAAGLSAPPAANFSPELSCVAIPHAGNENTRNGKEVEREFKGVIGAALPLVASSHAPAARGFLLEEFPWARDTIDTMLEDLRGRDAVRFRPTILLGPPGTGKTRFAKALLSALKVPYELVSCGGLSDGALGGTPRRWSTGEPSLPVSAMRRHKCAGPGLLLDEIEKASTDRRNGALSDVLLGMLGDETASRWLDPYLESECDLSHLVWLMTANEVVPLPVPLRDRCRILPFPGPGHSHLARLAGRLLEKHYVGMGQDPRWASPLGAFELEALRANWTGGSIRGLERLVEAVAISRERTATFY